MTTTNEQLRALLEAELVKPVYEGLDYRSGLCKALSLIRQHESAVVDEAAYRHALEMNRGKTFSAEGGADECFRYFISCYESARLRTPEQPASGMGEMAETENMELNYSGAMAEIQEIVRVATDNPAGLTEFLQLNFPREWGLTKMQHKALLGGAPAYRSKTDTQDERRAEKGTGAQETGAGRTETAPPCGISAQNQGDERSINGLAGDGPHAGVVCTCHRARRTLQNRCPIHYAGKTATEGSISSMDEAFARFRKEKGQWMLANQHMALDANFTEMAEKHAFFAHLRRVSTPTEEEISGWQPIESAPRDKKLLFGVWIREEWVCAISAFEKGKREKPPLVGDGYSYKEATHYSDCIPATPALHTKGAGV